ncbi:bacterioferritin [Sphaerisporangium album]|uniref:Bacterioferritin n=1 Tax=Sphaerisporangium album TaxID=509200 RepID=A0A367FDV5_9ACTN|nr:bacterioferritin [Sphaerisporangium album]RCG27867.1 bacterioferritin [Sphaerisporangium album]
MQGDKDIIALLNEQLTSELTAINQYFLHAKMQEHWGYTKLAAYTRTESIDEMRHAEVLTDRILFLEGLPNYQKLGTLHIGQTVREQLESDLQLELGVVARLRPGIALMRERGDVTSARIFEDILQDEEHHIDYLETELQLLDTLGDGLYLQRFLEVPGGEGSD